MLRVPLTQCTYVFFVQVDVTKWGDAINTNGSTSADIDSLYEKIRVKLEEESK